jgi:hypothetical protein
MRDDNQRGDSVKPTEQRGGSTPSDREAQAKGPWAAKAAEGVVPAELGGSDTARELQAEDPELGSSVLGSTTGSEEPATEMGIDLSGGDDADATSHGGPAGPPHSGEPDLKDAAAGPRQADVSAGE